MPEETKVAPAPTAPIVAAPAPTAAQTTVESTGTVPRGTAEQTTQARGGLWDMMPMIVGMILVFYFLIIRPEKKRQQHQKEMLGGMKENDKVILAGIGIYGTIAKIEGDDVTLIIDPKKDVRIKVRKDAIGGIVPDEKK
jgi:preprotein translocase subunit YajC